MRNFCLILDRQTSPDVNSSIFLVLHAFILQTCAVPGVYLVERFGFVEDFRVLPILLFVSNLQSPRLIDIYVTVDLSLLLNRICISIFEKCSVSEINVHSSLSSLLRHHRCNFCQVLEGIADWHDI